MSSEPQRSTSSGRHVALVVLYALIVFVLVEFALQCRSHWRYGQSVFNAINNESLYLKDERTGLKTLRPDREFRGSKAIIRTNSLGLRSAEVAAQRDSGSLRLAIVGASTVMGAYTFSNEDTFPAVLERDLRARYPARSVEVINAGIAGLDLEEQTLVLKHRIAGLHPDLVIVYPGFNDFQDYCRSKTLSAPARQGLPLLSLPSWLLSVELLTKNTVFLRTVPASTQHFLDPLHLDLGKYRVRLQELTDTAKALDLKLVLATNARAYRRDQPLAQQEALSETARYYNRCFDLAGLHELYDIHNRMIREHATAEGLPLLPLADLVPGGTEYFADATHFSTAGEQLVAQRIRDHLLDTALLPD